MPVGRLGGSIHLGGLSRYSYVSASNVEVGQTTYPVNRGSVWTAGGS